MPRLVSLIALLVTLLLSSREDAAGQGSDVLLELSRPQLQDDELSFSVTLDIPPNPPSGLVQLMNELYQEQHRHHGNCYSLWQKLHDDEGAESARIRFDHHYPVHEVWITLDAEWFLNGRDMNDQRSHTRFQGGDIVCLFRPYDLTFVDITWHGRSVLDCAVITPSVSRISVTVNGDIKITASFGLNDEDDPMHADALWVAAGKQRVPVSLTMLGPDTLSITMFADERDIVQLMENYRSLLHQFMHSQRLLFIQNPPTLP